MKRKRMHVGDNSRLRIVKLGDQKLIKTFNPVSFILAVLPIGSCFLSFPKNQNTDPIQKCHHEYFLFLKESR